MEVFKNEKIGAEMFLFTELFANLKRFVLTFILAYSKNEKH